MPEAQSVAEFSVPARPATRRPRLHRAGAALTGLVALVAMLTLALAAAAAMAAPEPEVVPRRWQLDIRTGPLRVTTMMVPVPGSTTGETRPRMFYYLPYTVTNKSGEDLLFAPSFELATDEGELMRSGRGVPVDVTRQIVASLENPFVQDQISIIGQLLQGEENRKDGVVVWPVGETDITEVVVYAAGFSGETATEEDPDGKKVVLRKTLMIRYRVPGTLEGQGSTPLEPYETRWIMR